MALCSPVMYSGEQTNKYNDFKVLLNYKCMDSNSTVATDRAKQFDGTQIRLETT